MVRIATASGRAKCGYCKGLIKEGTKCYIVGEYKTQIRLHINLKACARYKMAKQLEYEAASELTKEYSKARATELDLAKQQVKVYGLV